MRVFTVGFTKKSAEQFFTLVKDAGVKRILDVRLNNVSQLAGFAKRDDLKFFARSICGIDYLHVHELAPTQKMLDAYKKLKGDWSVYEGLYIDLLRQRKVEESLPRDVLDGGCLLCSEQHPHHCHRRLAAEYLKAHWGEVRIRHLV